MHLIIFAQFRSRVVKWRTSAWLERVEWWSREKLNGEDLKYLRTVMTSANLGKGEQCGKIG